MTDDELNVKLARMADAIADLAEESKATDLQFREMVRLQAEHSADINRLYREMSDHLRNGH